MRAATARTVRTAWRRGSRARAAPAGGGGERKHHSSWNVRRVVRRADLLGRQCMLTAALEHSEQRTALARGTPSSRHIPRGSLLLPEHPGHG